MEKETQKTSSTFLGGFATFVISTLLYAFAAWYIARTLNDNGVISWKLSWTGSSSMVALLQFVRVWDRVFMR